MTSTNWAGNLTYSTTSLERPTSVDELVSLVVGSPSLRALGSRHSFNRVADTAATQVSVAALPPRFDLDPVGGTVTVGAGARYGEFVEQLDAAGFALHNLASLPHISVAGAIATGTHGSGDRNGSLASAVAAIELVTADGAVRTIRRGDDDFAGSVVSLGVLGIVTAVTLDLQPRFDVRQDVFTGLAWTELLEHYDDITASGYSVSLFTAWTDDGIDLAWIKSRMDAASPAIAEPEFFGAARSGREHHPLPDLSAENTTSQLGVPGAWWDRLPHFKLGFTPSNGEEVQSEFLVPRRHAVDAIEAVRAFGPRIGPHLFVAELRTVAADDLWLSPTHTEDCLGIHFTWKQHEAEVDALVAEIGSALEPFGARPHWGKVFDEHAVDVAALYPRLDDFRALAARFDPTGRFRNDFVDRLLF